jgi:hypothetical protein
VADQRERLLVDQVAPAVVAALERAGGKAAVLKTSLDAKGQTARVLVRWDTGVLAPATVDFRYQMVAGSLEIHSDLYNGTMRRIDPKRPVILLQGYGFELGWGRSVVLAIEKAFQVLKTR